MKIFDKGLMVAVLLFAGTAVLAQAVEENSELAEASSANSESFTEWDTNNDALLDKSEFERAMRETFGEWDSNGDGDISRGEWKKNISLHYGFREYEGAYGDWDKDGSRGLDKDEFITGLMSIFDGNSDGDIDGREYSFWTREPDSR